MITIILCLHDNTKHFERSLEYYLELKCIYPLLVADSSVVEDSKKHSDLVDFYRSKGLDIQYYYFENFSYLIKVSKALHLVFTEYVTLSGVDDFRSLASLDQAIKFLSENPDYVFVNGDQYGFTYNQTIEWFNTGKYLHLQTIDSDDYQERVAIFIDNYSESWHGVFATNTLKTFFDRCARYSPESRFGENFLTFQCLLKGKMKVFKEPFIYRELSSDSKGAVAVRDFFKETDFEKKKELMAEGIFFILKSDFGEKDLIKADQISKEIIKNFYAVIAHKTQQTEQKITAVQILRKTVLSMLPCWIRNIKRYVRATSVRYKEYLKLNLLLRKNRKHQKEFIIINQLIKQYKIPAFRGGMWNLGQYERLV